MTLKPGQACEHELWHGTSADTIEEINVNGFNRSYSGKRTGNKICFTILKIYTMFIIEYTQRSN